MIAQHSFVTPRLGNAERVCAGIHIHGLPCLVCAGLCRGLSAKVCALPGLQMTGVTNVCCVIITDRYSSLVIMILNAVSIAWASSQPQREAARGGERGGERGRERRREGERE